MRILIDILKGILPLALLGIAALAAITMVRNRPVAEIQSPPIEPPGVRVHVVELSDVDMSVISEGTVRPRTESELVPEISGRVTSIAHSFAEGGFFEEGETLVEIDPFDYEQAVITARSQLAQSRLRLAQEEAEAEIAQREWDEIGEGNPRALTCANPTSKTPAPPLPPPRRTSCAPNATSTAPISRRRTPAACDARTWTSDSS